MTGYAAAVARVWRASPLLAPPSCSLAAAWVRPLIVACGLMVPLAALAELTNDTLLGPGLRLRPAYDGSAAQETELVPVVRYFGHPWFVRSTQGLLESGARIELAPGLHGGAQLAYEPGRERSESSFLKDHRVPNIGRGASVGVHLEWDHQFGPMPVSGLARLRQNIDSDRGAEADLRLSAGIYDNGRFAAGLFTQATWANAKAGNSFYGITPEQSPSTGLPAFGVRRGFVFGSFGLLWSLNLSQDWKLVGSIESRHLYGDAAHSPLVEQESNYYLSTGVAYRF